MKIKQVEELVGITQKNIRFYEDQGLLNVERSQNGYRDYSLKDVNTLQKIKLLRLIAVPIEDIRSLFSGDKDIRETLVKQSEYLDKQKDNMAKMSTFCKSLAEKNPSMDSLNVDECLEDILQLEKEGTQFMDIKNTDVHLKKKLGAGISAAVILLVIALIMIVLIKAMIEEPIPLAGMILLLGIPAVIMISIIVVFIQRNREIERGEEDEASKY